MGTEIDSLDIAISASVEKSNKAIDSLVDRLEKIQKSILSISKNTGLSNIADSLNAAAGSLSPAFKDASSSADKMVKNISDSLDNLLEKSKNFKFFGSDQKLDSTIEKYSNDLEKAIVKQEKLAVTSGVDSKKYLEATVEVKSLINILDSLKAKKEELAAQKIDLVQDTTNLSDLSKMTPEQLDEWFKALPSIQNAARDMEKSVSESFDNVSEKIVEFSGAWNGIALPKLDSLEGAGEQATDFANALASLKDITPRIDETDLNKLQNKLKSVTSHTEQLRYEMEKGLRLGTVNDKSLDSLTVKIQESENQAERLRERIAELSRQKSVSGLTASFSDFASALKSGALRLVDLLKSLLKVDRASKRFNGSLGSGIKTLLKYSLGIRSVYILVNKLRRAIKDGFKNLVQYSDEVNSSVSLLWNSLRQTKNALAAGFAPALNALTPIINNIIQGFIRATNAVNQLTSALLGKSTWIKAKQLTDDYRDSLNKAGKAAKGAVREFDELKVITTQDNGGAGDETPAEDMFETVEVETDISDFAERLKEMWRNADFTDLGEIIGGKIKNALDRINWKSVYEGARNFGKGLATFLNGLISPGLFGSVGKAIASGLNTAIYAALSFGENFDFKDFGLSIASGINNFFATFDFKALAKTINVWAQGIFSTISTAMANIDWRKIGQSIGEFLAGIDWGAILKSVGSVIWQALSAIFEMFAGVWDNAPIEAAVIGLAGIYKGLKLITASKFVSGIKKLVSNFKNLYKETGSVGGMINTVRDNLSGFQKAAIGITAVVGEYAVLKNAFYDIAKGSDNLVASLGQIVVGAGAASAALYAAFGPAGLVVAGVTGLISLFTGIKSAMNDLVDEKIGNAIRDAFAVPGGIPIENIAEKFKSVVGEVGDSFSRINEKSASMEVTKDNVIDVWTEIEQIKLQMDAGVISVEEGTERLTQLFGELATQVKSYFGDINSSLVAAFGENGAYRQYADVLGNDVGKALLTALGITGEMEEESLKLVELMSNPNISTEQYIQYQTELNKILHITDDLSVALSDFEAQLSGMTDYSLVFDMDTGELDTGELKKFYNDLTTIIQSTDAEIEQSGNSLINELQKIFESAASDEEREYIQGLMDSVTFGMESAKEDIRQQAKEITDMMQQDFIGRLSEVIEQAGKDWEALDPWEKLLVGGKDDYVRKYTEEQIKNIVALSDSIESEFKTLGINGAGWARETAKKIYEEAFELTNIPFGVTEIPTRTLNEGYKEIIDNALKDMPGYTGKYGEDAALGYAAGILAGGAEILKSVDTTVGGAMNRIQEDQDSHSPSKVTEGFGKDAVDGYNLGILENTSSTLDTISAYMTSVKDKFMDFVGVISDAGRQIMNGLLDGMSEKEPALYDKAGNIADNIANTVKNALDIHSPSRVMFRLGDFTMEGMEEGMESRYPSILSSLKGFSSDLQLAPMPTVSGMYGDYQKYAYTNAFSSGHNGATNYNSAYPQNNAETNALLREQNEILKGILAKEFGITESQIGRAAANYSRDYMSRTGRPAYSF